MPPTALRATLVLPDPNVFTRRQSAAYAGVSVTTIDRMIRDRELPASRVRNAVRVRKADLDDYLERSKTTRRRRRPAASA